MLPTLCERTRYAVVFKWCTTSRKFPVHYSYDRSRNTRNSSHPGGENTRFEDVRSKVPVMHWMPDKLVTSHCRLLWQDGSKKKPSKDCHIISILDGKFWAGTNLRNWRLRLKKRSMKPIYVGFLTRNTAGSFVKKSCTSVRLINIRQLKMHMPIISVVFAYIIGPFLVLLMLSFLLIL